MSEPPSRKAFLLRLDPAVAAAIEALAAQELRSVNGQIEWLLRESLADDAVARMVAEIFTRMSLTIVRRDRSDLIKAMIAMRAAFPQLSMPINPVPVRGSAPRTEVAGGV